MHVIPKAFLVLALISALLGSWWFVAGFLCIAAISGFFDLDITDIDIRGDIDDDNDIGPLG